MRLVKLSVKPAKSMPMLEARPRLLLRAGHGIESDANAAPDSPRQVLIASAGVYRVLSLPPGALRENLLVEGDIDALRSGAVVRVGQGEGVRIRLTIPCEPCHQLNRVRPGLAREVAGRRGFLGRVLSTGEVRAGDAVSVEAERLPPMPGRPRERVLEIASRIPRGRVLAYTALVRAAGLARSYVRVVPSFLAGGGSDLPLHRVVAAGGALPTKRVGDQRELLKAEGIAFSAVGAVPERFWWNAASYFGDSGDPANP